MRHKLLKTILALSTTCLVLYSCKDDDTLPIDFDELTKTGLPFATQTGEEGLASINKIDITPTILSGFSKTYELNSLESGKDVTKVDFYVSFTGQNTTVQEALYKTVQSSEFDTSGSLPKFTISFPWSDALTTLGLTLDDLEGGDNFKFRLALTNANGTFSDVSSNFDNQSADHIFVSPVVCLIAPVPGDWILNMTDIFGDGWNGGKISVNIDGVVSDFSASGSNTTTTINIPTGTAIFTFTYSSGNWEGENLYTLTNPDGTVVLNEGVGDGSAGNGPRVGELLNACPN